MDDDLTGASDSGVIVVQRRTLLQDAVRSYMVFVDRAPVGKIWAFQTKQYHVTPGIHTARLAIINTGTASSDDVEVTVPEGGKVILRSINRGVLSILMLPLSQWAGSRALATHTPIKSRFYKGPWIHLRVVTLSADGHSICLGFRRNDVAGLAKSPALGSRSVASSQRHEPTRLKTIASAW